MKKIFCWLLVVMSNRQILNLCRGVREPFYGDNIEDLEPDEIDDIIVFVPADNDSVLQLRPPVHCISARNLLDYYQGEGENRITYGDCRAPPHVSDSDPDRYCRRYYRLPTEQDQHLVKSALEYLQEIPRARIFLLRSTGETRDMGIYERDRTGTHYIRPSSYNEFRNASQQRPRPPYSENDDEGPPGQYVDAELEDEEEDEIPFNFILSLNGSEVDIGNMSYEEFVVWINDKYNNGPLTNIFTGEYVDFISLSSHNKLIVRRKFIKDLMVNIISIDERLDMLNYLRNNYLRQLAYNGYLFYGFDYFITSLMEDDENIQAGLWLVDNMTEEELTDMVNQINHENIALWEDFRGIIGNIISEEEIVTHPNIGPILQRIDEIV